MTYLPNNRDPDIATMVNVVNPSTSFGELATESKTPEVQINSAYGIQSTDLVATTKNSATVGTSSAMWTLQTGTNSAGFAQLHSKYGLHYKTGQGMQARFTARWDNGGYANSSSYAGLIDARRMDGYSFGYQGATFGINMFARGNAQVMALQITNNAGGGGPTATVTLNGTAFNVVLTGAASVNQDASELAAATYTGWDARQVGDTVYFVADRAEARGGTYSYSVSGGAGTFTTQRTGSAAAEAFVAQTAWNIDRMDGTGGALNPSTMNLDPTNLNVYQINAQWLGAGAINYGVEETDTGRFWPVHRLQYAGTDTRPTVQNPNFYVTYEALNDGNTNNLILRSASGFAAVQGNVVQNRFPRGLRQSKTSIGTTLTNVLAIRVATSFNTVASLRQIIPQYVSISVDGTKPAEFVLVYQPTLGGVTDYSFVDSAGSVVEYDTAGTTVTGGSDVVSIGLAKDGSELLQFDSALAFRMEAGDICSLAVRATSGSTDATVAFGWVED